MTPAMAPAIANLQMKDLAMLESKAPYVARVFAQLLGQQARIAAARGTAMQVPQAVMEKLVEAVADVAMLAYLKAVWRSQIQKRRAIGKDIDLVNRHKPIIFAQRPPFNSEMKRIAGQFDIDLSGLRKDIRRAVAGRVQRSVLEVQTRMNETLTEITRQGLPTKQGAKVASERLKTMGVSVANPSHVETLVRTHAQIAYNGAQWATHQGDDDVWGFTYTTAGDDRVRPAHVKLDGLTLKKDDPRWRKLWPPNGWNCRCQCVAIYGTARESRRKNIPDPDEGFGFNWGMELS